MPTHSPTTTRQPYLHRQRAGRSPCLAQSVESLSFTGAFLRSGQVRSGTGQRGMDVFCALSVESANFPVLLQGSSRQRREVNEDSEVHAFFLPVSFVCWYLRIYLRLSSLDTHMAST